MFGVEVPLARLGFAPPAPPPAPPLLTRLFGVATSSSGGHAGRANGGGGGGGGKRGGGGAHGGGGGGGKDGGASDREELLLTPIPPVNGSLWAMCAQPPMFREARGAAVGRCNTVVTAPLRWHRRDGSVAMASRMDTPTDRCEPSPLAALVRRAAPSRSSARLRSAALLRPSSPEDARFEPAPEPQRAHFALACCACTTASPHSQVGSSALCPCCAYARHPVAKRPVCNCNLIFPEGKDGQRLRKARAHSRLHTHAHMHTHTHKRISPLARWLIPYARGAAQAVERGHNLSLYEGHAPWAGSHRDRRGIVLDQLAVGTPRAMDAYCGLAASLPARFAEQRGAGRKTVPQRGFVTEELIGANVAHDGAVVVRPVTWLQWGTKRDERGEQEWKRGGDAHLGGRARWHAQAQGVKSGP